MSRPPASRRRVLAAIGAFGAMPLTLRAPFPSAASSASAAPLPTAADLSCVLSPAMMEGPYFIDERLNRSDLTQGTTKAGVVQGLPLLLGIDLMSVQANGCRPVAGVQVDVWHADASGEYSGVGQAGAQGDFFLRGYQVSDANGRVTFRTIYPGWYPGRTIHIHVKVRAFDKAGNTTRDFTSQLFFDDAASDKVLATPAYNARGKRDVRNAGERIFGNRSGALVQLSAPADGSRGYRAAIVLGLQFAGTSGPTPT